MKAALLLIGLVVFVSGCAHRPVQSPTGLKPSAFWKDQKLRLANVDQISAKLRLTFFGKNRSISGRGQLVRQNGEKVRLELRDPFGRVHYVAAQNGKMFTAHYPRRRLAYVDKKGGNKYMRQFLGMDLTFDSLHEVFLGRVPGQKSQSLENWKWDGEVGKYSATIPMGWKQAKIWVDGDSAQLSSLEMPTPNGSIMVKYSHFEPCCRGAGGKSPIRVAGLVEIKLSKGITGMEVEWERIRSLERPRPTSAFRIKLGKKDRKIDLEKISSD